MEKQQILPLNLTREIVDEISILYQETPEYQVVDKNGKVSIKDQELWDRIRDKSRYDQLMDKVDRYCHLLGTALVKVSFVDTDTGLQVEENKPGEVKLDVMTGGTYDIRHGGSPYYITELLIGFGNKFGGFSHQHGSYSGASGMGLNVASRVPSPSSYGATDARNFKKSGSLSYKESREVKNLSSINRIYWGPDKHVQVDDDNNGYECENPYGVIPAVPFFNQDPAHYYFLPINEPLIYANHACNMRITDLNHIAKFQSFGVPVLKGVERATSTRHGRPVDDHNQLSGGSAQSRFGGIGNTAFGAGGHFRTFDAGFGIFRDGNADANKMGLSLGPDTAVAVGEKGDFKFAHPSADIMGLVKTIHAITDMVRINHGLRPKYDQQLPASGFAVMMEKIGVLQNNIRRAKLFKEREQQLFQVIKKLWNTHHQKAGETKFSEDCELVVTYKTPEFPVDPKTKTEQLMMESKLIRTGDRHVIKKVYPHLSTAEINKLVKQQRKDLEEQSKFEAELEVTKAKLFKEAGISSVNSVDSFSTSNRGIASAQNETTSLEKSDATPKPKIDNRAKHSEESSKQPGRNGDTRKKEEG